MAYTKCAERSGKEEFMSKVSVIMPAYNAEKYIGEAIESILTQTYRDFELIIVNDGSIDRTEKIILSYSDSRIVYLKNETNIKISDTLNRGINIAQGEYIARMDSDDIALPERFERQVAYMDQNPKCVVCGTAAILFGEGMQEKTVVPTDDPGYVKGQMVFQCPVIHPSVMIRKSTLQQNQIHYNSEYNGTEDFELWWRLARYGEVISLREKLIRYRMHPNQITRGKDYNKFPVHQKFLIKRMHDMGITLSGKEMLVFQRYCDGETSSMEQKDVVVFLRILKKIKDGFPTVFPNEKKSCKAVLNDAAITCLLDCKNISKRHAKREYGKYLATNITVQGLKQYIIMLMSN